MGRLVLTFIVAISATAWGVSAPHCENLNSLLRDTSIESAYEFLERFDTSRKITKDAREKIAVGKLKIERLGKSTENRSAIKNPGALFDIIRGLPKIFVQPAELGVFAVLFFHELFHSADKNYVKRISDWRKSNEELDARYPSLKTFSPEYFKWQDDARAHKKNRDVMVFDAERAAFDAQRALLEEISEKVTCAADYFRFQEAAKELIVEPTTDDELKTMYSIHD